MTTRTRQDWQTLIEQQESSQLYQSALKFAHICPVSGAHLAHSVGIANKVVPSITTCINNIVISLKATICQMMLTQPTPDLLDGVQFR